MRGGKKGPLNSSNSEMKKYTNTRPTKGGKARNRQETGILRARVNRK